MKPTFLSLIFLCFFIPFHGVFAQSWKYDKTVHEVKGYTASSDDTYRLKLITTINSPLTACVATMADVPSFGKWNDLVISSKIIKQINVAVFHIYAAMDMTFPVSDRDIVFQSVFSQDSKTRAVKFDTYPLPSAYPAQKEYVRMKTYTTNVTFTPISADKTQMEYIVQLSEKDGIPLWLVENVGGNDYYKHIKQFKKLAENEYRYKKDSRVK